jgi:hypothetical protein
MLEELEKLTRDGKFFSIRFVKRTDGSIRNMLARRGVKSVGGGSLNFSPADHNLLQVFDMKKQAFRLVPAENVIQLRTKGQVYTPVRGTLVKVQAEK